MKGRFKYIFYLLVVLATVYSCERYGHYQEPDGSLGFSTDTVYFDTIFTTIGSTTRKFLVYNNYEQSLEISSIELASGSSSVFRLNVDGYAGNSITNVEILPKDSLYIFVEVTLDPNNIDSILAIHDSIVFNTNGNLQDVNLVAWGQDVHLYRADTLETTTWINDKPYLILDSLILAAGETWTIEEGVRIHMHKNAIIKIKGTLKAKGSLDNPITIQGDRLEYLYRDIPGQWGLIYFFPGTRENELDYVNIKNGIIGLWADTVYTPNIPNLTLRNCRIENMSAAGIIGQGTSIHASNTLVTNCGQFAILLNIGGSYEFYHCTVGNYWSGGFSNRNTPSLVLSNYYEDIYGGIQIRPIEQAYFGNCIIYGNKEFEFGIDEHPDSKIPYLFDHCLIKVDPEEFDLINTEHFVNVINLEDPMFLDYENSNFALDTLSPAKDKALYDIALNYPLDIKGESRLGSLGPDMGAYERYENDSISK
ncbi:right-handed parallel beta-helix repeat-containing protein [Bacteroidota bacterium]